MKKNVIFVINCMMGGGAERIMTLLANSFVARGADVALVLSNQRRQDAVGYTLHPGVSFLSLEDMALSEKERALEHMSRLFWDMVYRLIKKLGFSLPDSLVIKNFYARTHKKMRLLKRIIKERENAAVVSFLQYSHQLCLFALKDMPNRLIISERGDPGQHEKSITASAFIRKEYSRADRFVFQTSGAMSWYPQDIRTRGEVIPNPVSPNLPGRFEGERKKIIVNFCRISKEKNLPLLINAFSMFCAKNSGYSLKIIGDAKTKEGQQIVCDIKQQAQALGIKDRVFIEPFRPDLHKEIREYAMYVSSSDFEGMSNSMLEAMAIGLPTVCTDCPSGGARDVIQNGENGLLVSVGDAAAMATAMDRVAKDNELALYLSKNGLDIRARQSEETIIDMWEKIICAPKQGREKI